MGLLDKLWDDVVAGPQPDQGLGRLRKGPRAQDESVDEAARLMAVRRQSSEFLRSQDEARHVSQSIAIVKPPSLRTTSLELDCGSAPSTPGGFASSPIFSSLLGSPRGNGEQDPSTPRTPSSPSPISPASRFSVPRTAKKKVLQKFASEKLDKPLDEPLPSTSGRTLQKVVSEKYDRVPPSSPTVYDWVVLSALDR